MARPKAFDTEAALDAAIGIFREHGFEGTSAGMLVEAMGIGRQSLYDTFGDKWQLYCAAVRRYAQQEGRAHFAALHGRPRAIDGIGAMIGRVVEEAQAPCLGVGSICEFGRSQPELVEIHDAAGHALHAAVADRVRDAQAEGDIAADRDADEAADFLIATIASLRIAARSGSDVRRLGRIGELAVRAVC